MDFDAVAEAPAESPGRTAAVTDRSAGRTRGAAPGDPRHRARGGDRRSRPDRGGGRGRRRRACEPGSPPSPRSASQPSATTRGRSAANRWRWPWLARMVDRWPPRARGVATRLRRLLERLDAPLVGHEVKPCSSTRIWPTIPVVPSTRVAFDTQIGAYILNASLRSQTIADVCRRAARSDPAAARGRSAGDGTRRARGARGARRPPVDHRAARRRGPRTALPRDRAAADPGARADGGDRRRARPTRRSRCWSASSAR